MLNRKALVDVLIVAMTLTAVVVGMCAVRQVGYEAGLAAVIIETPQTQSATDIKSLTGKIADITGSTITIAVSGQNNRVVTTNSKTVFERMVPKDPKVFQSEIIAFNAKIKTTQATGTSPLKDYPVPFTLQQMSLVDFHLGETVRVTATENISSANQLVAARILLNPAPFIGGGTAVISPP